MAIANPSTARLVRQPMMRAVARGTSAPARPPASGSQIITERGRASIVSRSRGRDQEVEDERGEAEYEQRGVGAQVAGLERAGERAAGAHDAGRAADEDTLDQVA